MNSFGAFRVYLPEWRVVYTSDGLEVEGDAECLKVFTEKYEGRVTSEDWKLDKVGTMRPGRRVLLLRLPNLKGEHKSRVDADSRKETLGAGAVLVERGSTEERGLQAYGKRRLPRE